MTQHVLDLLDGKALCPFCRKTHALKPDGSGLVECCSMLADAMSKGLAVLPIKAAIAGAGTLPTLATEPPPAPEPAPIEVKPPPEQSDG